MNLTRPITKKRRYAECPDKLLDVANIPVRFRDCTLEEIPENVRYRKVFKYWVDNIKECVTEGKWLLLWGSYGTGKSGAASILLKETILRNGSAFMLNQNELVDYKLNSDRVPFGGIPFESVVKDSNMLLLDDVGTSRNKDIVLELIEWLAVSRYDNKRSLIVTTNLDPETTLRDYFSGKVMSMFYQIGTTVEMNDHFWREPSDSK